MKPKPKKAPIEREVRVIVPVEPDRIYFYRIKKGLLTPVPYKWEGVSQEKLNKLCKKIKS